MHNALLILGISSVVFIFINFVCHLTPTLSLQYYVFFGGEKYVDLGLGNNRVKCRVHKDFR